MDALPVVERSMSWDVIHSFAEARGLSAIAPGRISDIFMAEVWVHTQMPGRDGAIQRIMAEMRHMEGIGPAQGTKPAGPFNHPPLFGLHKKHYDVGGMAGLVSNIQLEMKRKAEAKRIEAEAGKLAALAMTTSPEDGKKLVADFTSGITGLFPKRRQRGALTGQWIVYAVHDGLPYYLCLGHHGDDQGNLDHHIHEKIVNGCVPQFPFLASILPPV